jgi:predicted anti-sigma-YlaC factor YlaD
MTSHLPDSSIDDLTCQELVEVVTDYLEGALAPHDLARFEQHLKVCPACLDYVEQIRSTIHLANHLRAEQIAPADRARLIALFRSWKNS